MDFDELVEKAKGNRILDGETSIEVLSYGISEFLKHGCTYTEALNIIENARVNVERLPYQSQFGPRASIEEEGDAP